MIRQEPHNNRNPIISRMNFFRQHVTNNIFLSDDEWQQFSKPFKLQEVSKKEFLLKEGEVCKFEAFVNKGLFKVYHVDSKGSEHVLYFGAEGWWVGDIDSFANQIPARLFIEALEHSEILIISKDDKETLYETLPKVERLFRIMGQKRVAALQRRMIDNLSKTATERYADFINDYQQITQRLTNRQIAAYLGMSHEFLSRIRRKIIPKK